MEESIRREVVVPASREDVWAALTAAERLAEWFANEVELDFEPGGEGVFRWDDGEVRYAVVEDVDHERSFTLRWRDDEDRVTCVGFTLADEPGGTRVTVVETAPPASAVSSGWTTARALRELCLTPAA